MIEILRQYVVKEAFRGQFELLYGPGGAWSKLFAQRTGYRGTTLLSSVVEPGHYLAVDFWETMVAWEETLAEIKTEYNALQAELAAWTESRQELGAYRARAEGTVRPPGKSRRSRPGSQRRGG